MKRLILGTFLLLLLVGCRSHENSYIIKNETNKKITIYGYAVKWSKKLNYNPIYSESFEIQPGSEYLVLKMTGEDNEPQGIFQYADEIDSVVISLNNEKFIRYSCNYYESGGEVVRLCNDKPNIIFPEYYEEVCSDHECIYTYTITEDDFNEIEK
jgi:hypothetical protein